MNKTRAWIAALRLRTLPLSLAGILLGTGIAAAEGAFDAKIFVLAVLTAASYQILSNLANDYGDGIKGTDRRRSGPDRALASGWITAREMKNALVLTAVLSFLLTVWLLKTAFPRKGIAFYVFLLLGAGAIGAAITYTVGKSAYGYKGWGDLFVLIFFGWVSVAGVYYLYTRSRDPAVLAAGTSIGLLAVAVLNINNMRDLENDRKAGKITLAVKMGKYNAFKYQRALIILSFLFLVWFTLSRQYTPLQWLAFVFYVPLFRHVHTLRNDNPETYNRALKSVSLLTFMLAAAYALILFSATRGN